MIQRISILYVDDEPALLELGRIFLEKNETFRVETSTSVRDATALLAANQYDIIVSDYQMQDRDGIDFLKYVRKNHGDLPFILFTGRGREEVVIEAINNGADFYLQKGGDPVPQFAELSQKIRMAVEKRKTNEILRRQTVVLGERVKELNCLYRLAEAINIPGISLDDMLQGCVNLIPSGYQCPDCTCVRVVFRDREFTTPGFSKSVWNQNALIFLDGTCTGTIEVSYTGRLAERVNDAFLAEENSLLNGVVKILENSIARKIAEDNLRDFCENRENPIQKDVPGKISTGGNLQRTGMEEDLRKSREQKEVLLREVQQRVKNNLRAVHDLLALQQKYIRDEKVLKTLHESQNRIRAMALVHEILYQTPEITNIDLALYVNTLGKNLFDFYKIKGSRITLRTDIPGICIGVNSAIPIGLIMNELISNALKHAFPGNSSGEIFIRVRKKDRSISLLVRDTGAGMPRDLNWRDLKSLGLRMVFSLVEQMNGTIGLDRSRGTEFSMVLEERK